MGAALLMYVGVGLAFSAVVFACSFFVDSVFRVHVSGALELGAVLAWAYPFMLLIGQQLSQGAGRLHVYSAGALLAQILVLGLIGGWLVLEKHHNLTVTTAFMLRSAAMAIAVLFMVLWMRPVLRNARSHVRGVVADTRAFGLSMYTGRVLSIATYNMDVLMLGAFADPRLVGFYTLAGSITALIATGAGGVGSALFPRMARTGTLGSGWLLLVLVGGLAATLGMVLLARPFIDTVFSSRYAGAAPLVLPLGLAAVVRGVTTIYNSFLTARGQGRELRNAGLALTGSNLILNLLLIPRFKATGAAWASVGALLVNLLVHVVYAYRPLTVAAHPVEAA
jgi:O-antigen/teichoic acid export membrane protein